MQALIEFLGAYEPMYRQVVKGYSPDEIARFEQALGRPAPSTYHDFLSTAAANVGFVVGDLTFDVDELIELATFKRRMLDDMSGLLTPIAVDLSPSCADYYMHLGRPVSNGDGEIVRSGAGSINFDDIHAYPSLRDMLFFLGFHRIRMLPLVHRCEVVWHSQDFPKHGPVPGMAELCILLEHLGFRPLQVTGPTVPLYERGDCAAAIYRHWNNPTFSIYIAAQVQQTAHLIAETLCDNMPGRAERYRD